MSSVKYRYSSILSTPVIKYAGSKFSTVSQQHGIAKYRYLSQRSIKSTLPEEEDGFAGHVNQYIVSLIPS